MSRIKLMDDVLFLSAEEVEIFKIKYPDVLPIDSIKLDIENVLLGYQLKYTMVETTLFDRDIVRFETEGLTIQIDSSKVNGEIYVFSSYNVRKEGMI
jgi:hypothetical protein